jgi:hypothetical protein
VGRLDRIAQLGETRIIGVGKADQRLAVLGDRVRLGHIALDDFDNKPG